MSAFESTLPIKQPVPEQPSIDAVGPHLGQMLVLFVLSGVVVTVVQFLGVLLVQFGLKPDGKHTFGFYADMMSKDARFLVPSEAVSYALVLLFAAVIFRAWWQRGFWEGLHWNFAAVKKRSGWLAVAGLGCGFGIAVLGDVMPMPKNPPITADIMHSPTGAWLMLLFGVLGAPLFEEVLFRGFLLPSFLNAFRWLGRRDDLSPAAVRWIGIPVSIALTSLPFALLHGQQVANAWAPVLLIGLVSVALCVVRLALNSLAASTVVHAAYNFTLFAGMLIQSDGFRHLEKLGG